MKRFSHLTYFLAGVVLTGLGVAAAGGLVVMRSGTTKARAALGLPFLPRHEVEMPADVRDELQALGAVVENSAVLAVKSDHDTILVQPVTDPVEWTLRPGIKLDVTVLPSTGDMDLDPPLLHVPSGAPLSDATRAYIRDRARFSMTYTTDTAGHRLTLPVVSADRKVLVIGDSVAFGVGVDDSNTMPSFLQRELGGTTQVVNAGVGGYDGQQAARTADVLSSREKYAVLVYVACQNDFMLDGSEDWLNEVQRVVTMLQGIAARFEGGVVVVLETHLEYDARDVLLDQGWPADWLVKTDDLRRRMPETVKGAGFTYLDWATVVEDNRRAMRSVLAPFALHADHAHLSPAGNRLMAERVASLLAGTPAPR